MISFEFNTASAKAITNDQFEAIHQIVSLDWGRDYIVTERTRRTPDIILVVLEEGLPNPCWQIREDGEWWEIPKESARPEGDALP